MKHAVLALCASMTVLFCLQAMEKESECPCERFLSKEHIINVTSHTNESSSAHGKSLFMLAVLCHEYEASSIKEKAQRLIAQDPTSLVKEYFVEYQQRCSFSEGGVSGLFDMGARSRFCEEVERRVSVKNLLKEKLRVCNAPACSTLYALVEEAEKQRALLQEETAARRAAQQAIKHKKHIESQYQKIVQQNIE